MEILLNELSLKGQYSSVQDFIDSTLKTILSIFKEIKDSGQLLLKKEDFFKSKITTNKSINDLFHDPAFKMNDEVRSLKSKIVELTQEPYWENSLKQDADTMYTFEGKEIWGSSLAEACERDKVVSSFVNSDFESPTLEVSKNDLKVTINNLTERGQLRELLWSERKISFGDYILSRYQLGKLNFSVFIDRNNFDEIQQCDQSLFLDAFRKFEDLTWSQIEVDDGFKYKSFSGTLKGYTGPKNLYKFRTSQKYRCHGYREEEQFFVLYLEVDHRLSDRG